MTSPTRPRLLGALALGAGVALSGCGTAERIGSAALVGREPISVASLQAESRQLVAARGGSEETPGALQRDRLSWVIGTRVLDAALARNGVTLTPRAVERVRAGFEQQVGGAAKLQQEVLTRFPVAREGVPEVIRYYAGLDALGAKLVPGDPQRVGEARQGAVLKALTDAAEELGVQVNPRYGSWDPGRLAVTGAVSGGLAKTPREISAGPSPVATPGATATP